MKRTRRKHSPEKWEIIRANKKELAQQKTEKRCYKCATVKPISEFTKEKCKYDGYASRCKTCNKNAIFYFKENNPNYFKIKGKERYDKSENPARYQKYQKQYLERIAKRRSTLRGKIMELLVVAKKRATKNNLAFDLDIDWAMDLCQNQNGCCKLTNIPFTLHAKGETKYHPFNPSLDKIDAKKGYTKDNTRLVCVVINLSLNQFGDETLKKMCVAFVQHQKIPLDYDHILN